MDDQNQQDKPTSNPTVTPPTGVQPEPVVELGGEEVKVPPVTVPEVTTPEIPVGGDKDVVTPEPEGVKEEGETDSGKVPPAPPVT